MIALRCFCLALAGSLLALPAGAAPTLAATGRAKVLVVGDGVARATVPYLRLRLPDLRVGAATEPDADSRRALELFRHDYDPSQSVIVFDAGQADDPGNPLNLGGNLSRLAAQVGDRCIVVPTVHAPIEGGISDEGKNKVVFEFAESHRGVQVAEWAGAAEMWPALLRGGGKLPTRAGARLRASLIAGAVRRCLALANGRPSTADRRPRPEPVEPLVEIGRRTASAYVRMIGVVFPRLAAFALAREVFSLGTG